MGPQLRKNNDILHDLNNCLGIIVSNTELLMEDLAANETAKSDLEEILHAGLQGHELLQQLKLVMDQSNES